MKLVSNQKKEMVRLGMVSGVVIGALLAASYSGFLTPRPDFNWSQNIKLCSVSDSHGLKIEIPQGFRHRVTTARGRITIGDSNWNYEPWRVEIGAPDRQWPPSHLQSHRIGARTIYWEVVLANDLHRTRTFDFKAWERVNDRLLSYSQSAFATGYPVPDWVWCWRFIAYTSYQPQRHSQ